MTLPFFSIVIPTKDRPALVANTLLSLSLQTFKNFEVILSDNFTSDSCREIFETYKDLIDIKYFKPKEFLIMADNFEFAFSKATGKYVTILEDKFMFYPFSLEYLFNALSNKDVDYISYPYDYFFPDDELPGKGKHMLYYNSKLPYPINSLKQIKQHLNFDPFPVFCSSSIPNTGYMLSGFFRRDVIEKIKEKINKNLFLPPAPDLTSQIFVSLNAKEAVYTGFPMVLVYSSAKYSTGRMQDKSSAFMKDSWKTLDPKNIIKKYVPYPELTASIQNFIAANYLYALSLAKSNITINMDNLLFRIKDNMENHFDKDIDQSNIVDKKIKEIPILSRVKNYFNKNFGLYFNRYVIFDYIGIHIWPLNLLKKYKILKQHRENISNENSKTTMTIKECLLSGSNYYKSTGFLGYESK